MCISRGKIACQDEDYYYRRSSSYTGELLMAGDKPLSDAMLQNTKTTATYCRDLLSVLLNVALCNLTTHAMAQKQSSVDVMR